VLRVKLRHLPALTLRRRELAERYTRELAGLPLVLPREKPYAGAVYHLYVLRHPRRDALMEFLKGRGIATLIHYPIPLHRQPAFANVWPPRELPIAERAAREILSLPLTPEMADEHVTEVVAAVKEFFRAKA